MSRRRLAQWLRYLADRVDHTSGPRAFSAHFNIIQGKGLVITPTEGVPLHPPAPGCPLWFMEQDYDRAFSEVQP